MISMISRQLLFLLAALQCLVSLHAEQSLPALAQIKAAAEGGDALAQSQLADAYYYRWDYARAGIWYGKAANQGVPYAQYKLGYLYESGLKSWIPEAKDLPHIQKDYREAIRWYQIAANQNEASAQKDRVELEAR